MNIFTNLINKRNLPANSKYAFINPFLILFVCILLYMVLYNDKVKHYLNDE